ncbi:MAG: amidase family protein, partial [Stellaceae bacterium]
LVPTNIVLADCEPSVLANFEGAIERLARAGAAIERTPLPAFDDILKLNAARGTILAAEAYEVHRERLAKGEGPRMDRRVASRLKAGAKIALPDYLAMAFARRKIVADANALLAGCFVAFPATPMVAPAIAPLEKDDALFFTANARLLRNTSLGNFLDWCGVSLPSGTDGNGMPTALLLSATARNDDALLSLAQGCEALVLGE